MDFTNLFEFDGEQCGFYGGDRDSQSQREKHKKTCGASSFRVSELQGKTHGRMKDLTHILTPCERLVLGTSSRQAKTRMKMFDTSKDSGIKATVARVLHVGILR